MSNGKKKKKVKRKDIKKIVIEGGPGPGKTTMSPFFGISGIEAHQIQARNIITPSETQQISRRNIITPTTHSTREGIHSGPYSDPKASMAKSSKYKSKSALRKAGLLTGEGKKEKVSINKMQQFMSKIGTMFQKSIPIKASSKTQSGELGRIIKQFKSPSTQFKKF